MIEQKPVIDQDWTRFTAKHRQNAHNARRLAADLELLLHSSKASGKSRDACAMLCRASQTVEEEAHQIAAAIKLITLVTP
jgi:hypothetical protein